MQKIIGILFILIGILFPFLTKGDITVSLFLIPVGGYLLFTKANALYKEEEE